MKNEKVKKSGICKTQNNKNYHKLISSPPAGGAGGKT